jgi:hypothetical protein
VHLKYQQAFWHRCWGNNWRKDFNTSLISANLVITSFSRITPILLNCGKDRTSEVISTFRQASTRKEEILKNPGCLSIQDPSTLEPCHLIGLYGHICIFSNHVYIGEEGQRHKNSNHISSDKTKCCTTHKFHLVSHGEFD